MKTFIAFFTITCLAFLFLTFQTDLLSTYDHVHFRRSACKHSLTRTAEALVSEKDHQGCLLAAQRKIYMSGSRLRKKLKRYPEGLQRIFLELLNRRLENGRSYKSTVHPLQDLRPIVKDYFINKKSLELWWQEREDILSRLEKKQVKTPCQDQIPYLSLNKFLYERYGNSPHAHKLHKEISKLYNLLAKIHFNGIDVCLEKLTQLHAHYTQDPPPLDELSLFLEKVRPAIKTLYESCYYPPTKNNAPILKTAYQTLLSDTAYVEALTVIERALKADCLKKEKTPKSCDSAWVRFENLSLIKEVIIQVQHIHKTFS